MNLTHSHKNTPLTSVWSRERYLRLPRMPFFIICGFHEVYPGP